MSGNYWMNLLASSIGASFINAFIVQFATTKVAGFKASYGSAYLASFIALAVTTILATIATIFGVGRSTIGISLSLLVAFLFGAILYGWILKHPTTGSIGIRKGILVSLVQLFVVGTLLGGFMLFFYVIK